MKIQNEFELIRTITKKFKDYHKLVAGVGDDTAVIKNGKNKYLLLTCDALVEGNHFNCEWSSPVQIGSKAVEVNVSDIASSGGRPTLMLVSLVVGPHTLKEWVVGVYAGMKKACDKYKITLVGGDTVSGGENVINVTLLGETSKPVLRAGAQLGDLVCVTGRVGGANAGLKLFQQKNKLSSVLRQKHISPVARLDVSGKIARVANSMIDVSDGVASEVRHICDESKKGAVIYADRIPLCAGATLADALSGGEDYELLFTVAKEAIKKLQNYRVDFTVIGEIVARNRGVKLVKGGENIEMPGGYDHFL